MTDIGLPFHVICMQTLRFDAQTLPGLAAVVAGIFLLLLGAGVIGRHAEAPERLKWQARRQRRFLALGVLLILLGIYLFLQAHALFY